MTTTSRPVRLLADAALSIAAVLGVLGILLVVAGATLGVRPLLFRSGSMAPTIGTGDLALARSVPASALHVGDVVSVLDASGHRVTHRVVGIEGAGDTRRLELRGDANTVPDHIPYGVTRADRVFLVVREAGRVLALAAGPAGMFVLGLYVAVLLRLALRGPGRFGRSSRPGGHRSARRPAVVATAIATACAVVPAGSADAVAWTDGVTVSGPPLTASTVPVTTLSCGGFGAASVTFNWTPVAAATGYTLHYGGKTVETANTSYPALSLLSSGTAWVAVNHAYGPVTWTSAPSNTISYVVAALSLTKCN